MILIHWFIAKFHKLSGRGVDNVVVTVILKKICGLLEVYKGSIGTFFDPLNIAVIGFYCISVTRLRQIPSPIAQGN